MVSEAESALDPAVAAFVQRLTTRDNPPQKPLHFDRASVEARIAAGLRARFPKHHRTIYPFLAHVLYGFLEQARWSTRALSETHNRHETTLRRSLRPLIREGLLERLTSASNSHFKYLRLSRSGEDWLQSLVQAPLPAPPAVPLG